MAQRQPEKTTAGGCFFNSLYSKYSGITMMRKKYMPRALGPLLLVVLSPAVAQQNDDNEIIVSASRSNRTVAEMAQTT
ncbi:TonB-dependent siderophore receptor, partial [Shigella flexneri]